LHKQLAAEKHVPGRQLLQVAVNRGTSLNLQGIIGITIICKSERDSVKQTTQYSSLQAVSAVVQSVQLLKLNKILTSNMIIIRETILTLCYRLLLQTFLVFGSVDVRELHTNIQTNIHTHTHTHTHILLSVKYSINKLSRVRN